MKSEPSGYEHRCAGCKHLQNHKCVIDDMRHCRRMARQKTPVESLDYFLDTHAKLATPECRLVAALLGSAAHEIVKKNDPQFGVTAATRADARAYITSPLAKGAAEIIGIDGELWGKIAALFVGAVGMTERWAK